MAADERDALKPQRDKRHFDQTPQPAEGGSPNDHGRADDEKKQPWLLIKERDEFVRPASEFSVVDEMPDSVQHLDDHPAAAQPAGRGAPVAADGPPPGARKAALPKELQPQLATLV